MTILVVKQTSSPIALQFPGSDHNPQEALGVGIKLTSGLAPLHDFTPPSLDDNHLMISLGDIPEGKDVGPCAVNCTLET